MIANRSKSYPSVEGVRVAPHRRTRFFGKRLTPVNRFYANDTTAYRPEHWAQEAVNILHESLIFGGTVHRDFENEISRFGQIVHTRKPASFTGKRKQNDLDNVEDQDATATPIQVTLDRRC